MIVGEVTFRYIMQFACGRGAIAQVSTAYPGLIIKETAIFIYCQAHKTGHLPVLLLLQIRCRYQKKTGRWRSVLSVITSSF